MTHESESFVIKFGKLLLNDSSPKKRLGLNTGHCKSRAGKIYNIFASLDSRLFLEFRDLIRNSYSKNFESSYNDYESIFKIVESLK